MTTNLPDRSWHKVKYLVAMDYYLRFIEILSLVETTSQVVTEKLKSVFER